MWRRTPAGTATTSPLTSLTAAARYLTATPDQADHNDRRSRARTVKHEDHACPRGRATPGHDETSGMSGDDQLHDDRLHAALNALWLFLIAVITAMEGDTADDDRTVSPAPLARP